jgi:ribosomal protein S18 acetylase RimI-like enzyme
MIEIRIGQLSQKDIQEYLEENSSAFVPALFGRIDIKEFSMKIYEKAIHFYAFDNGIVVGFLAAYFNHPQKEFGYITTFSTLPNFQNQGIASKILEQVMIFAKINSFKSLQLEVHKDNIKAINFYKKRNFNLKEVKEKSYLLEVLI